MSELFAIKYSYLIPLLPLAGALIAGFFGAKYLKGASHWPIWLGVGASAIISLSLLLGMMGMMHMGGEGNLNISTDWYTWISAGDFQVTAGFFFDSLTAVMLCVITCVGFLITVFAAGYMKGDSGYFRFFSYLGLFIFSMTCLVMGNNFVMLYLGWEGVGVCSYLLIGYYYDKPSAREAAKKAFLVNRVGDFGFGLGIMLIWKTFGTVSYFGTPGHPGVFDLAAQALSDPTQYADAAKALQYIPYLLMIGAFGKSAQFPLYVWLPDAMEGPTPVSALIHAATMVTAGVYMIARCGMLFVANESILLTVAAVGAFTALFAATIALRQFDLKKVFAYSTISQLGFMFVGIGVLAPVAAVFHLITHAFFKALLFLSSGIVMHAMAGELDMRKMSGIKRILPKTRWLMLIGCLALSGFPPFSGFFSKDEIVSSAFHRSFILGAVMLFTAFLTAYYTFRLYFRVFEGPLVVPPAPEGDSHGHGHDDAHGHDAHGSPEEHAHHNHEPMIMILPLVLLAIGAIFAGLLNFPKENLGDFLGTSPSFQGTYNLIAASHIALPNEMGAEGPASEPGSMTTILMILSTIVSAIGIGLAYLLHLQERALDDELTRTLWPICKILEAKYWVDEIYQATIVEPLRLLGKIFYLIDQWIIDGIIGLISWIPRLGGYTLKLTMQRGYLQGYAAAMVFGLAAILLFVFVS